MLSAVQHAPKLSIPTASLPSICCRYWLLILEFLEPWSEACSSSIPRQTVLKSAFVLDISFSLTCQQASIKVYLFFSHSLLFVTHQRNSPPSDTNHHLTGNLAFLWWLLVIISHPSQSRSLFIIRNGILSCSFPLSWVCG